MKKMLWLSIFLFSTAVQGRELEWHVVNRFPLFKNDVDFLKLEQSWTPHASPSEWLAGNSSPGRFRDILSIKETAWVPADGRYDKAILFRTRHTVLATLVEHHEGGCKWVLNGQDHDAQPCEKPFEFEVSGDKPFSLAVLNQDGKLGDLVDQKIETKLIVGLGDSFASGEGNPDWPTIFHAIQNAPLGWFSESRGLEVYIDKSAEWWDVACHRSLLSWQSLYALEVAMKSPHAVVQFASFSCSGAEIYDGFFRAQADPPGGKAPGTEGRFPLHHQRDGGPGYSWRNIGADEKESLSPEDPLYEYRLKRSQFNALAELLCSQDISIGGNESKSWRMAKQGIDRLQNYYGNVRLAKCPKDKLVHVDKILVSFGGNDLGFSKIVKWGLLPNIDENNDKKVFIKIGIQLTRLISGAVTPESAAKHLSELDNLYSDVSEALGRLGISGGSIYSMVYPNPLDNVNDKDCQNRNKDGYAPVTYILKKDATVGSDAQFGKLLPERSDRIKNKFIIPLQNRQRSVYTALGWRPMEADKGFLLSDGAARRTICAARTANGIYPSAEYAMWTGWAGLRNAPPNGTYSGMPTFKKLSEYDAYDPLRTRGMRYAGDALLTQSRRESDNSLAGDWLFGTAHPTAAVHAAMADSLWADERPIPLAQSDVP